MKLFWSPRSPFVRKVCITLDELGLNHGVERLRFVADSKRPPLPEIAAVNPLGKIPVLVLDDDTALYDSRVICEYLNDSADGILFPKDLTKRMEQLSLQALADGTTDILLAWRNEDLRGLAPNGVTDSFSAKLRGAMDNINLIPLNNMEFGIGIISLICCLGQLDFRWADSGWREAYPSLADWADEMAARPSVAANPIQNDTPTDTALASAPLYTFER